MGKILKEMAVIRKYSTEWAIVSALLTIPAGVRVAVTYSPPTNKTYIFDYLTSGPQVVTSLFTARVDWDGTTSGTFVSQGALVDKVLGEGEAPLKIAVNQLRLTITNSDTVAHTMDAMFFGLLVDRGQEEILFSELREDRKNKDIGEIKDLLIEINEKLEGATIESQSPLVITPQMEGGAETNEIEKISESLAAQSGILIEILHELRTKGEETPPKVEIQTKAESTDNEYIGLIEKLKKWYEGMG